MNFAKTGAAMDTAGVVCSFARREPALEREPWGAALAIVRLVPESVK